MNFGDLSKPQLAIFIICPGFCSVLPSIVPITLIESSNFTIPKILPSLVDDSSKIPGSFTGLYCRLPKQLLQKSLGGQLILWHLLHSPTVNRPCLNSDSKFNFSSPKPWMMLQLPTCSAQGLFWRFLPAFF